MGTSLKFVSWYHLFTNTKGMVMKQIWIPSGLCFHHSSDHKQGNGHSCPFLLCYVPFCSKMSTESHTQSHRMSGVSELLLLCCRCMFYGLLLCAAHLNMAETPGCSPVSLGIANRKSITGHLREAFSGWLSKLFGILLLIQLTCDGICRMALSSWHKRSCSFLSRKVAANFCT